MTETGADTITTIESADTLSGAYTQTQTGTDTYTLIETGTLGAGAYSESVVGTDTISQQEIGNSIQGTYTRSVSGGGGYSLSETGGTMTPGPGMNSYSLTETANVLTGDFSISETGMDRFGLLVQFDNIANTDGVVTPGHMNYNQFGVAFVDDDYFLVPLGIKQLTTPALDLPGYHWINADNVQGYIYLLQLKGLNIDDFNIPNILDMQGLDLEGLDLGGFGLEGLDLGGFDLDGIELE